MNKLRTSHLGIPVVAAFIVGCVAAFVCLEAAHHYGRDAEGRPLPGVADLPVVDFYTYTSFLLRA